MKYCCEIFEKALDPGTDNEEYGPLVVIRDDGKFEIGARLPPVRFCPWCGAKVE